MKTSMERVLDVAGQQSVIRPKDLDRLGIPRNYLGRLTHAGKLEKIGRGLYTSPEAPATEYRTLLPCSGLSFVSATISWADYRKSI